MKNIQKGSWFFLIIVLLLQISCTRATYIEQEKGQIIGTWHFDRVRIVQPFNINNITNKYYKARIKFSEDYTVIYTQDNGDVLKGKWTFNIVDGGEDPINQLVLQLENTNGEKVLFLWDGLRVTNSRMWGQEDYDENSQIKYRLRKIK